MNLDYTTKKNVYYHVLLGKITTRTSGWHRQNMLNSTNISSQNLKQSSCLSIGKIGIPKNSILQVRLVSFDKLRRARTFDDDSYQ